MIRATVRERPLIESFLRAHVDLAMFPLSNLVDHGMSGGHDYAMQFFISRQGDGVIDLLGRTESGMVMPVLPSRDYMAAATALAQMPVIGFAGPSDWVRGLEACGFADLPRTFDGDEPQFALDLCDLQVPDGPGELQPLDAACADTMRGWIADYDLNTLNARSETVAVQAQKTYSRYRQTGSHMVLMEGETPLSLTGFNAQLPDIVQIGGVYTPPEFRGRGHARRALALHLARAASMGVRRATLFSASRSAAAAYRAIGFRRIGTWTLLLLDGPQRRVLA